MLDQLQFPTPAQTRDEIRNLIMKVMDRLDAVDARVKALSGLLPAKLNEILDAVEKTAPAEPVEAKEAPVKAARARPHKMRPNGPPVVRAASYQPTQANTRPVSVVYVHRKLIDLAGITAEDRFQVWIDGDVLVIARNPVGRLANKWTDASVSIRSTDIGLFELPETPAEVSPGVIRVRIPSARP